MGKWDPLTDYLARLDRPRIVLTYEQIEGVLGAALPRSATDHRPYFWTNAVKGNYAQVWLRAGYRVSLRGVTENQVAFERDDSVRPETAERPAVSVHEEPGTGALPGGDQDSVESTLVLLGCVKSKASRPLPARDLYISELFRRRRAYAEASGKPWAVLSALHGLVLPDAVVEPYDLALSDARAAYLREWGDRVLRQLATAFGPLDRQVVEIHAGRTYVEPLLGRLRAAGAEVVWPFEGLRQGEHLAWYDHPQRLERQASTASGLTASPAPAAAPVDPAPVGHTAELLPEPSGIALRISRAFQQGELDLRARPDAPPPGWSSMPEVAVVEQVRLSGADDVTVRRICTFLMAMDRARDSELLWQRGVDLFEAAPWAFVPQEVARRSLLDLADVLRRFGVSQRHTEDIPAWRTIAETLADPATAPAVYAAVHEGVGDAAELRREVMETTSAGTPYFPLLSGPKISLVWVRILAHPGGAQITGLDGLPVGVDVQVRKVTEYLGVTNTHGLSLEEARPIIQRAWHAEAEAHGAEGPPALADTPAALDPALWFYGKWGCTRCQRAGTQLPISPLCQGCRMGLLEQTNPPTQ